VRQGGLVNTGEPLTFTIEQAGELLGVSRGFAYQAARTGELPTIKLGRRLLVPRCRLLELLGEPPPETRAPVLDGHKAHAIITDADSSG
jgi:excisionase family DNA binding protein